MRARTHAQRRLALQIAIQLPEDVAEAREVLGLARELLDNFLAEPSAARRRALRLGWGASPLATAPACPGEMARGVLCGLGTLLFTLPVAAGICAAFGYGAGLCLSIDVMLVALVFGTVPALAVGAAGSLLHNLLIVPPALEFNWPTTFEGVMAGGFLVLAFTVPLVERWRQQIRAAAIGEAAAGVVELREVRQA